MQSSERRLAAIMFTDIVGYSSLSERNEALALELLEEHRKLERALLQKYHGSEIKTMGDAFLVEFPSALDAVRCAFEIQGSSHELNLTRPSEKKVLLRIGIHLGDVVHNSNDVYGEAVNVASRVQPLAKPEGICVTQQVYDHVKNKLEFSFASIGKKSLKNINALLEIYAATMPWDIQRNFSEQSLDRNRIAVLPFANISPDPNDEYFADGLTEELISAISKIGELDVISRTSIMQYKNQSKRIADIGRELNVGTLLEGSVRKAGNQIRVSAQLIEVSKDKHLWAENYDRKLEDIFSIQSEIAEKVAGALKIQLAHREKEGIEKATNVEAYTLYLKGRSYYHRTSQEGYERAIEYFERAIEKDPGFALAYAGIASSYAFMGFFEMSPAQVAFQKAREYAKKALELDDSLPEAHLSLSQVLIECDWNFEAAKAEVKRAIELNPSLATAHMLLGELLHFEKGSDEGLREVERALELDPLSAGTSTRTGTFFLYSGHIDEGIKHLRNALEIDPSVALARGNLGLAYVRKGMYEPGIRELEKAIQVMGYNGKHELAYAYSKAGRIDAAKKILSEMLNDWKQNGGSPLLIAGVYSCLGEKETALEMLEKAVAERSGYIIAVRTDFVFENLWDDPRFKAIMKKIWP